LNTSLFAAPKATPPEEVNWDLARKSKARRPRKSRTKTWVGTVVPMSWVAPIVWTEDERWTDFNVRNRNGLFALRMPGLLRISTGMSLQFTVQNPGTATEEIVAIHRYAYGRTGEKIYPRPQ